MAWGGRLAFQTFGWRFVTSREWDAVGGHFGALVPIYGTLVTSAIALIIAVPVSIGIALFLTDIAPRWTRGPIAHRHRAARRHPEHHLRHVGPVRVRAVHGAPTSSRGSTTISAAMADHRPAVQRPADRHRHADRRHRARDHGHSVHRLGRARRVQRGARAAQGIRRSRWARRAGKSSAG